MPNSALSDAWERSRKRVLISRVLETWAGCQRCHLAQNRTQAVVCDGDPNSRLMIIGEGPGETEDRHGHPFIGRSGKFLREKAAEVGVDLGTVDPEITTGCAFWTNIVACRPPDNRNPMFDEIAACSPRLNALVAIVRPAVILVVGGVPLTPITGRSGITRNRGRLVDSKWKWRDEVFTIPALPTFHPAGLLPGRIRDRNDIEYFRQDIREAYDLAYGGAR